MLGLVPLSENSPEASAPHERHVVLWATCQSRATSGTADGALVAVEAGHDSPDRLDEFPAL